MASDGPRYPGTVATEVGPSGDNDWLTPENVGADDGSEAQITAATYDAGDHSYRLKATNFGFVIQAGASILGITVEIERRDFAGDAQDQEVRLYDSTATLVGDDKQDSISWPGTATIATYGGSADTWAAGLDVADINSANFGVALIVLANAANTDIGVDFIRVTIEWSSGNVSVTPGVASLTTARFAPTVTATDNKLVTPGNVSLVLTTFAPTVTVAAGGVTVTPGPASLTLTLFAPAVLTPRMAVPGPASLLLSGFAPTVLTPRLVTPQTASLTLTAHAPTVIAEGAPRRGMILSLPGTEGW